MGVPGKNIRPLGGRPLIAHAIGKALAAPALDRVVVSTDDPAIAAAARLAGAEVPFMREARLARGDTPMVPVILDALDRLEALGDRYDVALMLQANSPLLTVGQIEEVAQRLVGDGLDVVFTVCEASHPPQWSLRLEGAAPAFAYPGDAEGDRRQDKETLFRSTGAVYAVAVPFLRSHPDTARLCLPAPGQRSAVVVTDPESAVDIDSELDLLVAEMLYQRGPEGRR